MAGVTVAVTAYHGWENCVTITNGIVDLVVTLDVGPRIIRYGFVGDVNEFSVINETLGHKGGDLWKIYGGHRLWHSPEDQVRTYVPDNAPVKWERISDGIRTIQDTESLTGIKKEMEIVLSLHSSEVHLLHRLTNASREPIELSVWSISAMDVGGMEVIPVSGRDTGLLPNRRLSIWPYTRLNDPRLFMGEKYIVIRQESSMKNPFKIGLCNEAGWAAYFNHNHAFIKYYAHDKSADYPDFGVSYETYTNDFMLELETLSPLTVLDEGKSAEHRERWQLIDDVPMPEAGEDSIEAALRKCISSL